MVQAPQLLLPYPGGDVAVDVVRFQFPALIDRAGGRARQRFLEFFTAEIRNPNTRRSYGLAVGRFLSWCEARGFELHQLEPVMVAAYIEGLGRELAPPSVKQHLAALRMLFDYLVTGQVLPYNPASSVRGPKHSVRKGKTPVLFEEDARQLLGSIDLSSVVGLRDRAVLAVMTYSFSRVGALVGMRVRDYYSQGRRAWFILQEKGGRHHRVPAHHKAAEAVDAYLAAAGIGDDRDGPLFRSARGGSGELTGRAMDRRDVLKMVKRRACAAGLPEEISCHTFRATGITDYLANGGTLDKAAAIAGHASTKTTQLYDRTDDDLTLDEIERIRI
jgi:site-specific recombinase XerD